MTISLELPTTPQHVSQKIDIPKTDLSIHYDTYLSEPNENSVYVVSVWYYPPQVDMSKPDVNLKEGFQGMLTALPGAKVMKSEMFQLYLMPESLKLLSMAKFFSPSLKVKRI